MDGVVTLSVMAEALLGPRADLRVVLDRPLDLAPELGTEVTGRVLGELVLKTSRRLRGAGVKPGDEVAVVKSNHLDLHILAAAVIRLGGFTALLSGEIATFDVEAMLRRMSKPLLITDRRTLSQGSLKGLPVHELASRVIILDSEVDGDRLPDELDGADSGPMALAPDQRILVTHSSGTTGTPKMVIQSTSSLSGHVHPQVQIMRMLRLRGRPYAIQLAFGHVRTMTLMLGALTVGIPLVVISRPAADVAAPILLRERPYVLETYPNVFTLWEELAGAAERPLSTVRFFFASFDALHSRTCRRILGGSRRFMPVFLVSLGLSELGALIFKPITPFVVRHSDSRCIGWRIRNPRIAVRVADQKTGAPIQQVGVNGRLQARTEGRMITYYGEDKRAQEASDGEWFATGDIAHRTRWGCYHMMDREPEFDAEFGSGLRVEDALLERLPQLNEVVVIHRQGIRATPVYSTFGDEPIPAAAWQAATADLPPMAEPVHSTWSGFPRTATTKVRRSLVRKQLEAMEASTVTA
jgi:acyl-coenzyme A synthetase/AMP-(fatty) acid ligase